MRPHARSLLSPLPSPNTDSRTQAHTHSATARLSSHTLSGAPPFLWRPFESFMRGAAEGGRGRPRPPFQRPSSRGPRAGAVARGGARRRGPRRGGGRGGRGGRHSCESLASPASPASRSSERSSPHCETRIRNSESQIGPGSDRPPSLSSGFTLGAFGLTGNRTLTPRCRGRGRAIKRVRRAAGGTRNFADMFTGGGNYSMNSA